MANNKLYTKSYLKKRLREGGITCDDLIDKYAKDDIRYWAVKLIQTNDILVCYKTDSDFYFKLVCSNMINVYKTKSAEVLVSEIKEFLELEKPE